MKTERLRLSDLHWPLICVTLCICFLGLYNLHSSAAAHAPLLYVTQLGWFGLALILCTVLLSLDYRITESLAYLFYGVVCFLLFAVLFQGRSAGGARRWLEFGPVGFQPSELAKVATILCLARYFSQRIDRFGYTLTDLVRPFNFSRPLCFLGLLIVAWKKPWLVDPIGELARFVQRSYVQALPPLGNMTWFKIALLVSTVIGAALTIWFIVRLEKRQALLAPWPQGRQKKLIITTVLFFIALAITVVMFWRAPLLRDPLGYTIHWLYAAGLPTGSMATLKSTYILRVFLIFLVLIYFMASFLSFRTGEYSLEEMIIAPVDLLALPALLILIEPDLGTAGIVSFIGVTMILVVGVQWRSLLILLFIGSLVSVGAWNGVLKEYQKQRILTFMDPEHDLMGAGWHAVQSLIAVGSGRWFGKGHMGGTQSQLSFLPEQHTDFAFSVWAEEQGFIGCFLVLSLFVALLVMAITIAMDAREPYGTLVATGVAALILWQAIINVSMVAGAFPVVGITLPMFSYGGSSLLSILLSIALLLNIHWRRRS